MDLTDGINFFKKFEILGEEKPETCPDGAPVPPCLAFESLDNWDDGAIRPDELCYPYCETGKDCRCVEDCIAVDNDGNVYAINIPEGSGKNHVHFKLVEEPNIPENTSDTITLIPVRTRMSPEEIGKEIYKMERVTMSQKGRDRSLFIRPMKGKATMTKEEEDLFNENCALCFKKEKVQQAVKKSTWQKDRRLAARAKKEQIELALT
jgi:hypothetical protein